MKKLLAVLLCITCALWGMTVTSFAAENNGARLTQEEIEKIIKDLPPLMKDEQPLKLGNDKSDELTQKQINKVVDRERAKTATAETSGAKAKALSTSLPAKYSLVDEGKVTPVKNQGQYGTCWSFATCAAAESNLLMDGLGIWDLSELQLVYFTYHNPDKVANGLEGDYTRAKDDFLNGGNSYIASAVMGKHTGLTDESKAPYSTIHYGKKLKDSLAYSSNTAEMVNCDFVSTSEIVKMKENLMKTGAAATSFFEDEAFYNFDEYAYYIDEAGQEASTDGGGHAVTIVGWDDDFPKENFNGQAHDKPVPEGNGAWLIKNSWGTDNGFDNAGYFWISYYDYSINTRGGAFLYDMQPASQGYDNIDQYDGANSLSDMCITENIGYFGSDNYTANVFTSTGPETLKAVSITTYEEDDDYSIDIYKDISDINDPTSGTKVWSTPQRGSIENKGYHTVKLDKTVDLAKGEKYSVVVDLTNRNGDVHIPIDMDFDWDWVYFGASSKAGQSYISADGEDWEDIGDSGNCNLKIKAFTDDRDVSPKKVTGLKQSKTSTTNFTLGWKAQSEMTGYEIFKYNTKTEKYVKFATVKGDKNTYKVSGLSAGSTGKYKVRAYAELAGGTKYGSFSDTCKAATNPAKTYCDADGYKGKAKISWMKVSGASGYQIYMYSAKSKTYKKITQCSAKKSSYSKPGLKSGKVYKFKARAYKTIGANYYYGNFSNVSKCRIK